jgi:2-iminobutanoate/2-iminopropanoate deaminase
MSEIEIVSTDRAPAAIGPYSQAMKVDGWIFVSGQIPMDPATGGIERGSIAEQTHRVFRNLRAVLEEGGAGLASVVKTTVYLTDMANFSAMNEVYAEYFGDHRPARATVQAAGLPKGVDVEIDAVARVTG